jgi:hypothetical protein
MGLDEGHGFDGFRLLLLPILQVAERILVAALNHPVFKF